MNRPRLFLSAVSEELRIARKNVAATVRNLRFDPVSQDDFPTGYGELRQWLMQQVDSCEGLIQLVVYGYGAEPPEVDLDYGRVSYTQFEFLYANRKTKKTWVIVVGEEYHRDKPIDELDLPRETDHPDPAGYQAERRKLQQDYIARLHAENHLRYNANSDVELELLIYKLQDKLNELRQRWEKFRDEVIEAVQLTPEKIRAQLTKDIETTAAKRIAELEEKGADWREVVEVEKSRDQLLGDLDRFLSSIAEAFQEGEASKVFQKAQEFSKIRDPWKRWPILRPRVSNVGSASRI